MRSQSAFKTFVLSGRNSGFGQSWLKPNRRTTVADPQSQTWRPAAIGGDSSVVPVAASAPLPVRTMPGSEVRPGPTAGNPFLAQTPLLARRPLRVTAGNGQLPNDQGQVWRDYDISPYTARVTTTKRPNRRSSTGSFAKRAMRSGTASRSASSAPCRGRCASIIRRRCKPWWRTSLIALSPARPRHGLSASASPRSTAPTGGSPPIARCGRSPCKRRASARG